MAALVGLPSASKAALVAGPRFSTTLSCCSVASAATFIPKRRGDAYQLMLSKDNSNASNSSVRLSAKAVASLRSDFGGNSSVPISTNKFSVVMISPYKAGNQALHALHNMPVHKL